MHVYIYIPSSIFQIVFLCFSPHKESDCANSTAEFVQQRALQPRQKEQNQSLLDELTQEKLASKSKPGNKPTDLSSGTLHPTLEALDGPDDTLLGFTNEDLFTNRKSLLDYESSC